MPRDSTLVCGILVYCCFWNFLHTGHMQPFSKFSLFHIFWNKFNHFLQFSVSNNSMLLLCWLGGDWLKIRFCVRPTFSVVKLAPEPLIFSRARNFAAVSIMLKWSDTGKISWAKLSLKLCSAFLFLDCPNLFIIFRPRLKLKFWFLCRILLNYLRRLNISDACQLLISGPHQYLYHCRTLLKSLRCHLFRNLVALLYFW